MILESEELPKGSMKDVFVLGRQLLVVRAHDSRVYVTNPTCLHMGANFSSGGRVVDNNKIQCPFHGWKWDAASGALVDIPYSRGDCQKINAKIATWPVIERNKHIYLWFHSSGESPSWEPEGFDKIESGVWRASGRSQHEVLCHQQEIPENGADLAHLNFLHRIGANEGSDIINSIDLSLENIFQVTHTWNGEWFSLEDQKHIGVMHLKQYMQFMGWPIPGSDSFLRAEQVGPGIVHMKFKFAFGEAICLHHVTPIEPLLQKATFKFYTNINMAFCKFFMYSETSQFERDVHIWSNKTFIKSPLLAPNDGPINKFRRFNSVCLNRSVPGSTKLSELSETFL
ncbi:hypothetical protein WR25_09195 [Diploscapter pachys]|uniref:cholesterol 7-desaturase n=1 Tax=Diploscapter pachys TaxID=2018661 RepID=A0A2A2LYC3_9BILA|nr:hypothetical protein WR25_09195 [Diploscapter pachys]